MWGKQGWGPGEFDWVHGIVVDSKGAVYAADTYGQRIQKFVRSARRVDAALTTKRTNDERHERHDKEDLVSCLSCLRVFVASLNGAAVRAAAPRSAMPTHPLTQQRRAELAGQIDRPAPRVAADFFDDQRGRRRGGSSADRDRSPARSTSGASARRSACGRAGGGSRTVGRRRMNSTESGRTSWPSTHSTTRSAKRPGNRLEPQLQPARIVGDVERRTSRRART